MSYSLCDDCRFGDECNGENSDIYMTCFRVKDNCEKLNIKVKASKTNADKLRTMKDEELAKLLSGEDVYPWCAEDCKFDKCYDCVMDWLKKVVKE